MALKRLYAALIDILCIVCIFTIIMLMIFLLYSIFEKNFSFADFRWFNVIFYTMMLIGSLIFIGYFFCCDYFWKGNSIGKVKMRIIAENEDGTNIKASTAIFRALLKTFSVFIYPTYIFVFFNRKNKTFYDFILKTQVGYKKV